MRPRWLWAALLLIPGGLILAAGLGIAWAGLVLLLPGLRRMTAAMGGPERETLGPAQPYGEPHEPSPRVLDYALEGPDHVPDELRAFVARGFVRLNRWRES
jgi:hypothetical protein